MARTERDIMRHKRYQILQQVAAEFGIEPSASGGFSMSYELDVAFEKALAAAKVYPHRCSPYCLYHWRKRINRRHDRRVAQQAVRNHRWDRIPIRRTT